MKEYVAFNVQFSSNFVQPPKDMSKLYTIKCYLAASRFSLRSFFEVNHSDAPETWTINNSLSGGRTAELKALGKLPWSHQALHLTAWPLANFSSLQKTQLLSCCCTMALKDESGIILTFANNLHCEHYHLTTI